MRAEISRRRAGLRNVVVRAEFEPDDAVDGVAARREHKHGNVRLFAQNLEHFDAVHLGHHHVENHQVEGAGFELADAFGPAVGGRHQHVVEGQVVREERDQIHIVVDEKDAGNGNLFQHGLELSFL